MRKYDRVIILRVDGVTEQRLKKKAVAMGVSAAEYIRRLIQSDALPDEKEHLRIISRNIAALGNNLNQIAKQINSGYFSYRYADDIEDAKRALVEMKKEFNELKNKIRGD